MNKTEFDKFADEYRSLHSQNIRVSGEKPEYFAEYKILDTLRLVEKYGLKCDLKILDFGSGIGNSVPFISKYFPAAKLTCVDVSERSLEIAKERFPDMADYQIFGGQKLSFPAGRFDVVFTACVFHHIPMDEHMKLFDELHRVLAIGGMVIVFEHNPMNPLTVRAVNNCPFDENAVLVNARTLANRLWQSGFADVAIKYRVFFPNTLKFLRFLETYMGWIPFGAQYYVVGRKYESG
jgi:SAM-dependent methyltransferase